MSKTSNHQNICPSFIKCVLTRFRKQKIKDYLLIIQQEIRFFNTKRKCLEISAYDFYKILLGYKAIQEREGENNDIIKTTTIDSQEFEKLKTKYKNNIKFSDAHRSTITTQADGKKITVKDQKISFKNLILYFADNFDEPLRKVNLNIYENGLVSKTDISFDNVIVLCGTGNICAYPYSSAWWYFVKNEESFFSFTNCFFRGVSPYIVQKSSPYILSEIQTSICLKNTVSVAFSDGYILNTDIDDRYPIDSSEKSKEDQAVYHILIENCYFNVARITGINLTLKGRNIIREFTLHNNSLKKTLLNQISHKSNWKPFSPQAYWGPYQKITPENSNWQSHKSYLLELKKQAEERQDNYQVNILKREILVCDHNLIKQEPWLSSWQDRLTFFFNAWFTNYGISWMRPTLLLFSFNALVAVFIIYVSCNDIISWKSIHIFAETFNPLSRLSDLDGFNPLNGKRALVSILDVTQKIILAICIYEIIRAARRFSRQL